MTWMRVRKSRRSYATGPVGTVSPLVDEDADRRAIRTRRPAVLQRVISLAQEVAGVLAAVHEPGLGLLLHHAYRRRPAAHGDSLPAAAVGEVMRRDRAPDLVGGECRTLLVGLRQDDHEVRRAVGFQEAERVRVADGPSERIRQLP